MNKFAENFRLLRQEKGVGMEQLAKELGVSLCIVSYWESGKREPTMHSLIKIARYFRISLDELVGFEL